MEEYKYFIFVDFVYEKNKPAGFSYLIKNYTEKDIKTKEVFTYIKKIGDDIDIIDNFFDSIEKSIKILDPEKKEKFLVVYFNFIRFVKLNLNKNLIFRDAFKFINSTKFISFRNNLKSVYKLEDFLNLMPKKICFCFEKEYLKI